MTVLSKYAQLNRANTAYKSREQPVNGPIALILQFHTYPHSSITERLLKLMPLGALCRYPYYGPSTCYPAI